MSEIGAEASGDNVVSGCVIVKLTEADIPVQGALLIKCTPWNTPSLNWSGRYFAVEFKSQVLGRKLRLSQGTRVCHYFPYLYVHTFVNFIHFRICKANRDEVEVVNIDGSYLHRKYQNLVSSGITASDPGVPAMPLTGWEQITEGNYKEMAKRIPKVTHARTHTCLLSLIQVICTCTLMQVCCTPT